MQFAFVKGELRSCSCNFVSVRVENRGEKLDIFEEMVDRNFGVQLLSR